MLTPVRRLALILPMRGFAGPVTVVCRCLHYRARRPGHERDPVSRNGPNEKGRPMIYEPGWTGYRLTGSVRSGDGSVRTAAWTIGRSALRKTPSSRQSPCVRQPSYILLFLIPIPTFLSHSTQQLCLENLTYPIITRIAQWATKSLEQERSR